MLHKVTTMAATSAPAPLAYWRGDLASRQPAAVARLAILSIALLLPFAAGLTAWWGGLEDRFIPVQFGVVEPGRIYRSGQISRYLIHQTLASNHIGQIVDLSSPWEDTPDAREERKVAAELGIGRINLSLRGNGLGDPAVYPKAIEAIVAANRGGKGVLVHCQSGSQRTGGIIAAYRILIEGMPQDQAFAEMRQYGHRPHGNPKLIPFIQEHLPQWRAELAKDRVE